MFQVGKLSRQFEFWRCWLTSAINERDFKRLCARLLYPPSCFNCKYQCAITWYLTSNNTAPTSPLKSESILNLIV